MNLSEMVSWEDAPSSRSFRLNRLLRLSRWLEKLVGSRNRIKSRKNSPPTNPCRRRSPSRQWQSTPQYSSYDPAVLPTSTPPKSHPHLSLRVDPACSRKPKVQNHGVPLRSAWPLARPTQSLIVRYRSSRRRKRRLPCSHSNIASKALSTFGHRDPVKRTKSRSETISTNIRSSPLMPSSVFLCGNKVLERTQTLKFKFLYVTDSTLKPIVGIVVTTSPI